MKNENLDELIANKTYDFVKNTIAKLALEKNNKVNDSDSEKEYNNCFESRKYNLNNILDIINDFIDNNLCLLLNNKFNLSNETISEVKNNKLSDNELDNITNNLILENPEFFQDKMNIIYLKLVALWKEDVSEIYYQDFYFMSEKFMPFRDEYNSIDKNARNIQQKMIIDKIAYNKKLSHYYEWIIEICNKAKDNLIKKLENASEIEKKYIKLSCAIIDKFCNEEVNLINNPDKFRQIIKNNTDIHTLGLAELYCKLYSNQKNYDFDDEENFLIHSILSDEEIDILNSVLETKDFYSDNNSFKY